MNPRPADRIMGAAVELVRAGPADAETVALIVTAPGVVERWTAVAVDELIDDLAIDDGTYAAYLIHALGEVVGMIQYGVEADPQYRHAGIDVAIRRAWQRRGIGTDAIRTLARHLIADMGHHRLVIDPASDNAAAIECYERLGFRRVGVMRRYERGPDGTFHDGLLMDLLAGELL